MNRLHLVKLKRACAFALFALLLVAAGMTNAIAQTTFEDGDLAYSVNQDGTTVTVTGFREGFTSSYYSYSLTIPYTVTNNNNGTTYIVTAVADYAFNEATPSIGYIYLPESKEENTNYSFSIGDYAFAGCTNLESVYYPRYLGSIGAHAFEGCTLLSYFNGVTFNDTYYWNQWYNAPKVLTTIGESAFEGCERFGSRLQLMPSVTTVGDRAFYGCGGTSNSDYPGLTEVYILGTPSLGSEAFVGCTNLTGIYCVNTTNIVTQVAADAFDGLTSTAKLYVPLARLQDYQNNSNWSNTSITIDLIENASIIVSSDYVKYRLNYFDRTTTVLGPSDDINYLYGCSSTSIFFLGEYYYPTSIATGAFMDKTYLTSISFDYPDRMQSIGANAFKGCENLESISGLLFNINGFGNYNLGTIGASAFEGCEKLSGSLILPSTLETVGNRAFYGCGGTTGSKESSYTGITEVHIGGTPNLGSEAFAGCTNIEAVYCSNTAQVVPQTGPNNAFDATTTSNATLYVPQTLVESYGADDYWKDFGNISTIESATVLIDFERVKYRLNYSNHTATVVGPADNYPTFYSYSYTIYDDISFSSESFEVIAIEPEAFINQTNLNNIYISSHLQSIGTRAFKGCTNLQYVYNLVYGVKQNIDNSAYNYGVLTTIGESAFEGCEKLSGQLLLRASVTTVGARAFYGCGGTTSSKEETYSGITEVYVLGSPSIGENAFAGCTNLTDVYCFNSQQMATQTGPENAFNGLTSTAKLRVHPNRLSDYRGDEYWDDFANILSLDDDPIVVDLSPLRYQLNYSDNTAVIVGFAKNSSTTWLSISPACQFLDELFTITAIEDEAFMDQTNIYHIYFSEAYLYTLNNNSYIIINNSIQSIGARAFKGCTGLQEIENLHKLGQLQTIGESAFEDCSSLTAFQLIKTTSQQVNVPTSLTTIGSKAFKNSGLTGNLEIPACVTSIGDSAYYGCSGLNGQIILYGTAEHMLGSSAFVGCNNITGVISTRVTPPGHVEGATNAFTGLFDKTLYVPEAAISAYEDDSYWREFYDIQGNGNGNIIQNGFIFSLDETTGRATVRGHTLGAAGYTSTILDIPGYLVYNGHNYPVTTVADYAFQNYTGPTSINLPDPSDHYASKEDSYTYYDITIGAHAFEGCTSVRWFNNMSNAESIGSYAFSGCTALQNCSTSSNRIKYIGDHAFYNCPNMSGSFRAGNYITSIGAWAFANTKIDRVELEGFNLSSIGEHAFDGCQNLRELSFGYNMVQYIRPVTLTIGDYAFKGCVNIGNSNSKESNISPVLDLTSALVTSIGAHAFDGCEYITQVVFSDRLTTIGAYAFKGCKNLKSLTSTANERNIDLSLPFLTSIGEGAFDHCSGFTGDLTIGNHITTIPAHCFDGVTLTGRLILGQRVSSIGVEALVNGRFSSILSLAEVPPTLGTNAFDFGGGAKADGGIDTTIPVMVPKCNIDDYASASGWDNFSNIQANGYEKNSSGLIFRVSNGTATITGVEPSASKPSSATLVIPEKISAIDCNSNNPSKTEYTVTAIDHKAFYACTDYTGGIEIPSTVTSIGHYAFAYSSFTGPLNLPEHLTFLGGAAFAYCRGFTGGLTLPEGLTTIPDDAFMFDSGLTGRLTIPSTVTSIGQMAFGGCGFTGDFFMPNSVTDFGMFAIALNPFDGEMVLSNNLATDPQGMFLGQGALYPYTTVGSSFKKVTLGRTTEVIMYYALTPMANFWNLVPGTPTIKTMVSLAQFPPLFIENDGMFEKGGPSYTPEEMAVICWGINPADPNTKIYVPCSTLPLYENMETYAELAPYFPGLPDDIARMENYWRYLGPQGGLGINLYEGITEFDNNRGSGDGKWNTSGNWSCDVPANNATAYAIIAANCTLDRDVTVGDLYINRGCTLTVPDGFTLTAKHIFTDEGGNAISQVIVKDGGQLIHDIENVNASVERDITGYSQSGSWNFIASPTVADYAPTTSNGILNSNADNYDLYYYDEAAHYWRNYKPGENSLDPNFKFNNGQGYLYANSSNAILKFNGAVSPSNTPKTFDLSYSATIDEDENIFAGWNLVGNPFTCNATINKSFYKINNGAINTDACTSSTPIEPCEGVMVVAENTDENVTFTRVTPQQGSGSNNAKGSLNVRVARKALLRGEAAEIAQDNAIVSFDENDRLPKFVFNADAAKIYIPQNGKEYAIAVSEMRGELPVHFKAAENGSYTITVIPEGVELSYLHLIDNITGDDTDLLATPSYSFEAKMSDYESRFRLLFSAGSIFEDENGDSETFAYYNGSEWVIANGDGATVQLVDVMGRVLVNRDAINRVSTSGYAPGIYVLRLVNGENVKTQKIVIR